MNLIKLNCSVACVDKPWMSDCKLDAVSNIDISDRDNTFYMDLLVCNVFDERAATLYFQTYIYTYHWHFIPEGVAEVSQIFLRDTHVLPKIS
jgi:hypothetical protein